MATAPTPTPKQQITIDFNEAIRDITVEIRDLDPSVIEQKATAIAAQVIGSIAIADVTASGISGGFVTKAVEQPADYVTSRALSMLSECVSLTHHNNASLRYRLSEDGATYQVWLVVGK